MNIPVKVKKKATFLFAVNFNNYKRLFPNK